jgi:hypothetical protein
MYGDNSYKRVGSFVDVSPKGNTLPVGTNAYYAPGTYVSDGPKYVKVFSLEGSDNLDATSWK